jgi:hypothetical protein
MNDYPELGKIPESLLSKTKTFTIEATKNGFWSFFTDQRSPGRFEHDSFSKTLKWVVDQIYFGHLTEVRDPSNGEVVGLRIGKESPIKGESEEALARRIQIEMAALGLAGVIAQCRESGSSSKTAEYEKILWGDSGPGFQRCLELHYTKILAGILGNISEKLPCLEHLPILDRAPAQTKKYIAEATRCYLFQLENACISLCRACLEDALDNLVTRKIQDEIYDEMSKRRKKNKPYGRLFVTIEVLSCHGILGKHKADAHAVRTAGNDTLHPNSHQNVSSKQAEEVLTKTRRILNFIYRKP